MQDFAQIAAAFARSPNERFALATLIAATGSSYRRPGARMLISGSDLRAGSLSAGCLEDEVAAVAGEVIATGETQLINFDTRRRFGCHGSIEILIERASNGLLEQMVALLEARLPFLLETTRAAGTRLVDAAISADGFVQRVEPVPRLLIIGSGPDAVALQRQARCLGWESSAVKSIAEWRGETDSRTAAVIATHNYGRDCAALRHLLPLGLPYLGVIGPRRRRDEMLNDALDAGAAVESQLYAPAGLHLGAETPGEIALSVVAEIQMIFAEATAVSLRSRRAPIHAQPAPVPA